MKAVRILTQVVALALLLGLGAGCDDVDSTAPVSNIPPVTTISGGPKEFDEDSYLVDLKWYGEDVDGSIDSYEYAWDDTAEWFSTVLTESTFVVNSDTCCLYDTLVSAAGADSIVERFFRYHTYFVRAIDDKGERDPSPAYLTFNATTVAPFSRIVQGPPESSVSGRAVSLHWEGSDPDSPDNAVAGYEYFHATKQRLRERYGFVDAVGVTRKLWNSLDWIRVGADTTSVVLRNLETGYGVNGGNHHIFFIRSIDDAGAVEQIPVRGQNYRTWGASAFTSGVITIRSNVLGTQSTGSDRVGQVFEGTRVVFSWRANLGSYDGVVTGYSHAYDNLIWSAWDLNDVRYPAEGDFTPLRGRHTFFARARDEAGEIVSASFPFEVFAGPRNLDTTNVLLLNNFHISANTAFYPPPDRYRDWWTDSLLVNFKFTFYDPRTELEGDPPIRLMSRSTTIIVPTDDWEGGGGSYPIISEWHTRDENPLWSYVDAGGNLLILGFYPDWSFTPDNDFIDTGFVPEPDPCQWWSNPKSCGGSLIWYHPLLRDSLPHPLYEYCALETTWLDQTADYLWGAKALVSGLPDLHVDSTRSKNFQNFLSPGIRKGLWNCERITYRDDRGVVPLYGYSRTANPLTVAEPPNKEAVAIYIPSDGVRGDVVYMAMPEYFFRTGESREMIETILTTYLKESMRE
jgi:hypothetical protein